jgi:hypothetical protein
MEPRIIKLNCVLGRRGTAAYAAVCRFELIQGILRRDSLIELFGAGAPFPICKWGNAAGDE